MVDEPNFDKNKQIRARLVVDRFDFQKHIDGEDFFQEATSVTLDPIINIGGSDTENVREAIEALNGIVVSGAPDATATIKGILKLTNDLGGTADLPQVVGFRSRPITNAVPSTGESIVWNGSQWVYQTISGTFSPGDDLTGSSTLQQVIGLTGTAGVVDVKADNLLFNNSNSNVEIGQESVSGVGGSLSIKGQTSSASSGGDLILRSGSGATLDGDLTLEVNTNILTYAGEVTTGKYVLGLVTNTAVTSSQMPSGAGNHVVYVKNALSNPSANPTLGAILYSNGASLYTRRGSGLDFEIGDAQSIKGIDVNISGIEDGYGLLYNSSSGDWEVSAISGAFVAGNDLSGTSTSQTVIGLRGRSISTAIPSNGQVLTYTGSNWAPASVGSFVAGNDLSGSSTSQDVVQITGYDNGGTQQLDILVESALFDGYVTNVKFGQAIAQGSVTDGYGQNFTIFAQDGYRDGTKTYGGDLILQGGRNGDIGVPGSVKLELGYWSPQYGGSTSNVTVLEVGAKTGDDSIMSFFDSLSNLGKNPDNFFSSTQNVLFWKSGVLNNGDYPTLTNHCALWYTAGGDLWFANLNQATALSSRYGTATITSFGAMAANEVAFADITVSGFTTGDSLHVFFDDPAAIGGAFIIQGWKYQAFETARVYFISLDTTSPADFNINWTHIVRA